MTFRHGNYNTSLCGRSWIHMSLKSIHIGFRSRCVKLPLPAPHDTKQLTLKNLRTFFQNSSQLLTDARICFKDAGESCSLTVAGQKWYVLTKGEDVAAAYRANDGSLTYVVFCLRGTAHAWCIRRRSQETFQSDRSGDTSIGILDVLQGSYLRAKPT
jgi:hypothetical protein